MSVKLKALPYPVCPDVYQFDHWEGGVVNPALAETTVIMDTNKLVTAVFMIKHECGDYVTRVIYLAITTMIVLLN
jgi:hypothetical protein